MPLIYGKAAHLSDHVLWGLGVIDEAPVPCLAHILGYLVVLVEVHGHGIAQSHGWTCTAALRAR